MAIPNSKDLSRILQKDPLEVSNAKAPQDISMRNGAEEVGVRSFEVEHVRSIWMYLSVNRDGQTRTPRSPWLYVVYCQVKNHLRRG